MLGFADMLAAAQPERFSARSASKGSSNVDMLRSLVTSARRKFLLRRAEISHRPAFQPGDAEHAVFMLLSCCLGAVGRPSSIGSGWITRDHSFQEPKYIRTSFTLPVSSAQGSSLEARAPLKQ